MSTVARRIASVPVRTSIDTWSAICELLSPSNTEAANILSAVANVAGVVISEEYTRDAPIIVLPGTGSRIRIYTVHGPDAVDTREDETPLSVWPLEASGWTISLPCSADELDDLGPALAKYPQISLRDYTSGIELDQAEAAMSAQPVINLGEMERP